MVVLVIYGKLNHKLVYFAGLARRGVARDRREGPQALPLRVSLENANIRAVVAHAGFRVCPPEWLIYVYNVMCTYIHIVTHTAPLRSANEGRSSHCSFQRCSAEHSYIGCAVSMKPAQYLLSWCLHVIVYRRHAKQRGWQRHVHITLYRATAHQDATVLPVHRSCAVLFKSAIQAGGNIRRAGASGSEVPLHCRPALARRGAWDQCSHKLAQNQNPDRQVHSPHWRQSVFGAWHRGILP